MVSNAGLVPRAFLQNYNPVGICIKGNLVYTPTDLDVYGLEKKYGSDLDGFLNGLKRAGELNDKEEEGEPIKLLEQFPLSIDTSDQTYEELVKHEIEDILEMMESSGYVLREMGSDNGNLKYSVDGLYDLTLKPDSSSINYELKFNKMVEGVNKSRIVGDLTSLYNLINCREKKPTETLIDGNWNNIEVVDWETGDGREEEEGN
ncbi:MAG: hypothetical protein KAT28_03590 [Candidatus Aenigmarchaeota archaeon]|nr:hypothetical protein [Candidatus Aenigmarchaeota archaeon]